MVQLSLWLSKVTAPIQPGVQPQKGKSDLPGSTGHSESALHEGSGANAPRDSPSYVNAVNTGDAVGGTVTSNRPGNISFEPDTGASPSAGGSGVAREHANVKQNHGADLRG